MKKVFLVLFFTPVLLFADDYKETLKKNFSNSVFPELIAFVKKNCRRKSRPLDPRQEASKKNFSKFVLPELLKEKFNSRSLGPLFLFDQESGPL